MAAQGLPSVEVVLAEATERSNRYDWAAAAELYNHALERLDQDREPQETGRLTELLAKAYFKTAFQSTTREEFEQKMRLAQAVYEKSASLFERARSGPHAKRSKARSLYAAFWLEENPDKKIGVIKECVSHADEALQALGSQQERGLRAEALKDLLTFFLDGCALPIEWDPRREWVERAAKVGGEAIDLFTALGDEDNLLETLHMTHFLHSHPIFVGLEPLSTEKVETIVRLEGQLAKVSESLRTPLALCLSNEAAGRTVSYLEGDDAKALSLYEAGATKAEFIRDSHLVGRLLGRASSTCGYVARQSEDSQEKRAMYEKMLELAQKAIRNLEVSRDGFSLDVAYGEVAEGYSYLAKEVETEAERKREYFRKAIETARKGRTYEGSSRALHSVHALSKGLYFLSSLEEDPDIKRRLLGEALLIVKEEVRKLDLIAPDSFDGGLVRNYLALIIAELSLNEKEATIKVKLLQEAVSYMQQCVDICSKWVPTARRMLATVARFEEWYGDILVQLQRLTGEAALSQKAVKVYQDSIDHFVNYGQVSLTAGIWWKIAKAHDILADYKSASDAFRKAAEGYRTGAKVPALSSTFNELASYMDAWTLIEDAKSRHANEQYQVAAEDYKHAADMLRGTTLWSHLSNHYKACSLLEEGEAHSHGERNDLALDSFTVALEAFEEAKAELENKVLQYREVLEKQEVEGWLNITIGRERYCLARAELEEAKVLDVKGEEEASRAKYASASERFSQLHVAATNDKARKELETLTLFASAWAKMKEAEADALPEAYSEAAELFLKVEKVAMRKRSRLLAQANASMCRALEFGTRFRRTRDTQFYGEVKKQLETAGDSYREAGLKNAAEWTRATQRMFDALAYLANAETEMDSERKMKLYHLAQNHFELAAKLYGEAGYVKRKEEVLSHLMRAREEKEVLLTPIEALSRNPASSSAAVAPVSLLRDQAVGLEKFEGARVVGNLFVYPRELAVGSDLILEMEMANVGKTPATLVKLENIADEGLEFDRKASPHRIEDNFIDMKGKRLDYLKTQEIKLMMKALRKGPHQLRPRILYVDEKGGYHSYDFEPTVVTVKELGVSGWLKGPG